MSGRAAPSGRRRHGAAATRDRERRSLRSAPTRFRQRHKTHGGTAPCACATALQRDSPPLHATPLPAAPNKSQGEAVPMRGAAAGVPDPAVVLLLLKGPHRPAPPCVPGCPRIPEAPPSHRSRALHPGLGRARARVPWAATGSRRCRSASLAPAPLPLPPRSVQDAGVRPGLPYPQAPLLLRLSICSPSPAVAGKGQ